MIEAFKKIKNLITSQNGRKYGWFIEMNGVVIGELIDCRFTDMFWDSYYVKIYKEHDRELRTEFNWNECKFQYRNKFFNEYAEHAFPGGTIKNFCIRKTDRINFRGLYLLPETRREKILFKILSFFYRGK